MRLSEAIEALLLATQANGRSSRTVEAYREKLSYLLEALGDVPVETITVADLRRYVAGQLARTTDYQPDNPPSGSLSPFTVAGRVRALKRLFNFLVDEELLDANPARRIKTPHPRRVIPKGITHADLGRLLDSTKAGGLLDLRDRAIMLLLADTGCRLSGLCGLRLSDVELEARRALVTEKGEKTRPVYFLDLTANALGAWLKVRPNADTDALFLSLTRWGTPQGPLTGVTVSRMLSRRAERVGITGKVNAHSFRHAFARDFLMSGGDLAALSDLLGHSDVLVTKEFYGILTGEELRQKHAQHSPIKWLVEGGNDGDHDGL